MNDLDVEFAINKSNKIYILQVRKLIINNRSNKLNTKLLFEKLKKDKQIKTKTLLVEATFFGVMPDWNLEIIGIKPRPLALSVYQSCNKSCMVRKS